MHQWMASETQNKVMLRALLLHRAMYGVNLDLEILYISPLLF